MSFMLIAGLIFLYSLQSLFQKFYNDRFPGRPGLASPVFCVYESVAIALVTLAFAGFHVTFSLPTAIIGLCNAAALYVYNTAIMRAGALGSYAFMNVALLFGGILVPMGYSVFFLREVPSLLQFAAIGVMLVSFVLMNLEDIKMKGTGLAYYGFCLLLFLSNGFYSTFIKLQSVVKNDESNEMIILTFLGMGAIAFIRLAVREKKAAPAAFRVGKTCAVPLAACLVVAALAINALVFIIPMVNAVVFYTVEAGGVLLLSALYAVVFFKEKPSPFKIAGIVLAALSITALSL